VKRRFRSCYSPPRASPLSKRTEFKRVRQGQCQNGVQPVPISSAEDSNAIGVHWLRPIRVRFITRKSIRFEPRKQAPA
jgi:hypothetical protein